MLQQSVKVIYFVLGSFCLVLGVIGIFVPLLPTTPLIILAAFLFSKSSKKVHDWLISRPLVGPAIIEWRTHRVIRPKGKILATIAILIIFSSTIVLAPAPLWAKAIVGLLGVCLLWFILSRRSAPPPSPPDFFSGASV